MSKLHVARVEFSLFEGSDRDLFGPEFGKWKGEIMGESILNLGKTCVPDKDSLGKITFQQNRWLCTRVEVRTAHGLPFQVVHLVRPIAPHEIPLDREAAKLARQVGWRK